MAQPAEDAAARPRLTGRTVVGWAGLGLHLLVGFPYLVSGLIVPHPAVELLWLLWAVFFAGALLLMRRRPVFVPLVPLAALGAWFAILAYGSSQLHWQG